MTPSLREVTVGWLQEAYDHLGQLPESHWSRLSSPTRKPQREHKRCVLFIVLIVIGLTVSPSSALLPCSDSGYECTELQHQQCEDTDGDGRGDTCLCEETFYLRLSSCQPLSGQEDYNPCDDDNPCKNDAVCVYNQTSRSMACRCLPGFTGQRCDQDSPTCGPGSYLHEVSNRCRLCAIGQFKAVTGPHPCTRCPLGPAGNPQLTPAEGSITSEACIPVPNIAGFFPPYGPLAGGTIVNVTLDNMSVGYNVTDISEITVADVPCKLLNRTNDLATNMTQCRTSSTPSVRTGLVEVSINGMTLFSDGEFKYMENPVILKISDPHTIQSGGITITIHGDHLDSVYAPLLVVTSVVIRHESRDVRLSKAECTVIGGEKMECQTPDLFEILQLYAKSPPQLGENNTTRVPETTTTTTTTTTSTMPITTGAPAESFPTSRQLEDTVPEGEGEQTKEGPEDGERAITRRRRRRATGNDIPNTAFNDKYHQFWLGFELDGVDGYRNVTELLQHGQLLVFRNPLLKTFKENIWEVYYHQYDEYNGGLIVEGYFLDQGARVEDYTVHVGQGFCNVSFVFTTSLHCILPPKLPPPSPDRRGGPANVPGVRVVVGNLRMFVGFISYNSGSSSQAILGAMIAVPLAVLILVAVACYLLLRRHQKKNKEANNANLEITPTLLHNIYSREEMNHFQAMSNSVYLQPLSDPTPRPSLTSHMSAKSGTSLTPLVMPMPHQLAHGRGTGSRSPSHGSIGFPMLDGTSPGTPTTPNTAAFMADNVAYQLPRHDSIPFDIMDAISADLRLIIEECRIASSRLQLKDSIGKGFFGKVYRGTLTSENNETETTVAIKTIQGKECQIKDVEAFLGEAIVMKDCHHENVLSLLGVVIAGNRPFAVLPFMEYGDLKSYISEPDRSIKVRELLGFGVQVAAGMQYLAGQKIVHRDLATRNCMINKELTVRIADFGLSRDIYKSEYYRVEDKHRPLPVKWMAVESLTGGVFSSSSDVWSFGVLLWELLTRGCPPYPDIDTFNLKNYLLSGRRLPQPEHAPDDVYSIMTTCWKERPEDRPTFTELKEKLTDIVEVEEEDSSPEYLKLI